MFRVEAQNLKMSKKMYRKCILREKNVFDDGLIKMRFGFERAQMEEEVDQEREREEVVLFSKAVVKICCCH